MGGYACCERRFVDEAEEKEDDEKRAKKLKEKQLSPIKSKPQNFVNEDNEVIKHKYHHKYNDSNNERRENQNKNTKYKIDGERRRKKNLSTYGNNARIKIEKMIIRLENQPNVKIKRYIEDRVQKNPAKIEREYNPFKRNLSSIPSFDQLLPAGNIDALTIKNTSQIPDPVDESDLELQYELEKISCAK